MLAIMVKQWINMFVSRMRAPVPNLQQWGHRHRAFKDGLDRWHFNAIVSMLSVALHGAVLLFLIGLLVHLFKRDVIIFGLILCVTILTVAFYVATTIAPLFDGTCPTATPLLIHGRPVCIAVWRAIRRSCGRDLEAGRCSTGPDKPPFHPDVVIPNPNSKEAAVMDVRILAHMATNLPAGHDLDTVLDAIGGLDRDRHMLGSDATRWRDLSRRRLEQLGRVVGTAATDAAAVARAIRSSIFIERQPLHNVWPEFTTQVKCLRLIPTHDVFALTSALELLLNRREQQVLRERERQERQEQQQQQQQQQQQRGRQERQWLQSRDRPQREQSDEQDRWLDLQKLVVEVTEPIGRWNLQRLQAPHPISALPRDLLFEEIERTVPEESSNQHPSLEFCAALVLSFGGEPTLRQRCHQHVTPLVNTFLQRNLFAQNRYDVTPAWKPLPDTLDWRLRAIDTWAHATSLRSNEKLPLAVDGFGDATICYSYLLTLWREEQHWRPLLTMAELHRLVLPAGRLKLPAAARSTLWDIATSTWGSAEASDLQVVIVRDILQGVALDQMLAVNPTIAESVTKLVHPWFSRLEDDDPGWLLRIIQPSTGISASGEPTAGSAWEVTRSYLSASSDTDDLAQLVARASTILSAGICDSMIGEATTRCELLLGGGIGRRLVWSHVWRREVLVAAGHACRFASKQWEEMREELEKGVGTWTPTEGFEDAAAFVKEVERLGCTSMSEKR